MEREPALESRRIYEGRILNLRVDTVQLHSGRTAIREIVEHGATVTVVPVDGGQNVLLVRQFRKAVGDVLLEAPAGGLDPGEPAEEAAQRELREETGFAADRMRRLGAFWLVPGYGTEYMHVFLAQGLRPSPAVAPDDEEGIEVVWVPARDIPEMVRSGQIQDAKSIAALAMALPEVTGSW